MVLNFLDYLKSTAMPSGSTFKKHVARFDFPPRSSWTCGTRKSKLLFPLLLPAKFHRAGVPDAKLRFVHVPQLRTSFPRDLARTCSDPLPCLQQDQNEVPRLRRGHRAL